MPQTVKVLPEKYSEKNLMTSVMGMIGEYIPISQTKTSVEEQVFWTKFEECDANTFKQSGYFNKNPTFQFVVSLGTCKGFYLWGIPLDGKATLLFAERNMFTIDCKLLPTPSSSADYFSARRPLLALCDILSGGVYRWQVRLVSLLDYQLVRVYTFESKPIYVIANASFIVLARTDSLTVLSATTLDEQFTIKDANSTKWPTGFPKSLPCTLGTRWLAFADIKPVYQHLSRCGDASSDESEPLTSTVMNVNKRIWDSLSSLVSTGSSTSASCMDVKGTTSLGAVSPRSWTTATVSSPSTTLSTARKQHSSATSAGYVTVVDLVALADRQSTAPIQTDQTQQPQCLLTGTRYLNVHDFAGSGCLVSHFMAHRWASVAMLKFDPTGSLLFTACSRGHSFNLFRLSSHPCDQRQTAIHHLYILERGTIPCEVVDVAFSWDSRWLAVSSNHGTTHVFPITAYGGAVTVRTHTLPHVVNRTSRYHRSSGLEEHHLTRPQQERGSMDPITSVVATSSGLGLDANYGVTCCTAILGSNGAGWYWSNPPRVSGSLPPCPHIGRNFATASQAAFSAIGDTQCLATDSHNLSNIVPPEGLCACPPNAQYNTTNPRLPPYPEPCQLRPEARLRPHNPASGTSGVAAAALEAATAVASSAASNVTSTTFSSGSTRLSFHSSPAGGGYVTGTGSAPGHSGPCIHFPQMEALGQPSIISIPHPTITTPAPPHHHQPLPTVESFCFGPPPMPRFSGIIMAAQFGAPVCFLPRPSRHSAPCDPYGGKFRAVDSLFILTGDLYLVEYDLCVLPSEAVNYGEKLYQDGAIRLECNPIGEWNLRTDVILLPPFPVDHPLIEATQNLHFETNLPVERASVSTGGHTLSSLLSMPSTSSLCEADTCGDPGQCESVPKAVASMPSTDFPSVATTTSAATVMTPLLSPAPVGSWSAEDVANYWYSQVEITTHLGPLRRVWLGPQFSFHAYSTRSPPLSLQLKNQPPDSQCVPNVTATTTNTTTHLPRCGLHPDLLAVLSNPVAVANIMTSPDDYCASRLLTSAGQASSLTDLFLGKVGSSPVSLTPYVEPVDLQLTVTGRVNKSAGVPIQHHKHHRFRKCRTQSGDLMPTRPLSITNYTADSDVPIVIEGSSYQDSSLGSSLSSLVGRNPDDVAQFIAEAIQDEEVQFSGCDSSQTLTVLNSTSAAGSLLQSGVRLVSTPPRPSAISIQPTLSEADFPSQDTSPMGDVEVSQSVDLIPASSSPSPSPSLDFRLSPVWDRKPSVVDSLPRTPLPTPVVAHSAVSRGVLTRSTASGSSGDILLDTKSNRQTKRTKRKSKRSSKQRGISDGKQQSAFSSPCFSESSSLATSPATASSLPESKQLFVGHLAISTELETNTAQLDVDEFIPHRPDSEYDSSCGIAINRPTAELQSYHKPPPKSSHGDLTEAVTDTCEPENVPVSCKQPSDQEIFENE